MSISFNSSYNQYPYNSIYNKSTEPSGNNAQIGGIMADFKTKGLSEGEIRALKKAGKIECQTCKNRTYQDGSNDPGVSFKTPGHIDPASSASVVMGHEQEHVKNENAKAQSENRRVVSQSVSLQTSVCPECGKSYVSGGETRTVTKSNNNEKKDFLTKALEASLGKNIDLKL